MSRIVEWKRSLRQRRPKMLAKLFFGPIQAEWWWKEGEIVDILNWIGGNEGKERHVKKFNPEAKFASQPKNILQIPLFPPIHSFTVAFEYKK